ncbi:hypothetical protein AB6A40_004827 [Gnathostoma spinigerum]|uniref:Major facilitator superfamily (MFS) profile domain-containing protein n=1 Tax=Gnathostoma spinigerum TaxID=75299 RepID=A0ABD6EMD2_9BILA
MNQIGSRGKFADDGDEKFLCDKIWSKSECRQWTIMLFLGTCTLYASRVALPICATALSHEYLWNKSDSGTVLSCFFWGYAFTQLFAGTIADTVGGERVLRTTTFVWTFFTFFTPQLFDFSMKTSHPLFFVLVVRIATGIGQGFHLPCMASITSRHLTSTEKGRIFGICLAGSHLGTAVAGAVGSILLDIFGWRTLFHFVGLISFIWWLIFRHMTSSLTRGMQEKNLDAAKLTETPLLLTRQTSLAKVVIPEKTEPVDWKKLLTHSAFWAAAVAQYSGANAYYTLFSWLPSYFADNFPSAKGVVFNVVPSLAIVVTSFTAPFLASKLCSRLRSMTIARRIMEGTSLASISVCLFLLTWTDRFLPALMIITLAMAARGLHHGGASVNACDFAPQHTGSVFGVFNTFSSVTGFIGVYIAGYILHKTSNNWSLVFIFTALQCVVGALVYSVLGTATRII